VPAPLRPAPPPRTAAAAPRAAGLARAALRRAVRALDGRRAAEPAPHQVPVPLPTYARPFELLPGANVAGYFKAELGVGEGGRLLLATIAAAGIEHSTVTTDRTASRQAHPFVDRGPAGAPYDVNIVCVNADQLAGFAHDVGPEFFDGRYTIGMWHWEVEDVSARMLPGLDFVDEVWCGSQFTAEAVRTSTDKPVHAFSLPVRTPVYPATVTRADLGLPDDRFVFLFVFDFFSTLERKNPMGVVSAFTRAFAPGEGPLLVLKSVNGHRVPEKLAALRAAVGDRPDVLIRDEYLSAEHKSALIGLTDCYVSLHRSEGFGLTVAEAMALGKPVVTTAYSGTMDFTNEANSYLVPYELVPIPPGCDPYPAGSRWAEADVDVAAAHMRAVVEDPATAKATAGQARTDIETLHTVESRVPFVRDRIEAAHGAPRRSSQAIRAAFSRHAGLGDVRRPERGLEKAIRLVNTVPDLRSATDKGRAAYFVRRAMRRLTHHQNEYQRDVNMALTVAIQEMHWRLEVDMVSEAVRHELQLALTSGWSYELGLQLRAHIYSLLVENGMRRMQTYGAIGAIRDRYDGTSTLAPYELRVFSQNGEDGVLAELVRRLGEGSRWFVEFGVESGQEGNCVLLADVLGWNGLFIEADPSFFANLAAKYAGNASVVTRQVMVTPENVEAVFAEAGVPAEPDVLSIDVDGNDWWIWRAVSGYRPRIVVIEYNSALEPGRALVQPYSDVYWDGTDFYGASIGAMCRLAAEKGYTLVYQELAGVNAFFVRDDLLPRLGDLLPPVPRAPNYFLNAQRHPADPAGRTYLDLDA
jgi:glycosyltransferase involved in cell wall biosynthesis